ncbi:T-cell antigen CD7-like [Enoplosus armatus]|uniref:T-cell antigen CD7-like n=1 Tax=Enoplosus armatus TaxID=215367 RepID=UPI00399557A9
MSAVWLKFITILCLSCEALSDPGSSGVVWRDFGGTVTIQCRSPEPNQEFLSLKMGLSEENTVLYKDRNSDKTTIATEFTGRLQLNGEFPNVDILIKNLTSNDTGPYWCEYKRFDQKFSKVVIKKGEGSVLLVVKDTAQQCEPSNKNLILVPVAISAAVLVIIFIIFLILIIHKTKALRTTVKPRRVITNDVYEDMRGTLRR